MSSLAQGTLHVGCLLLVLGAIGAAHAIARSATCRARLATYTGELARDLGFLQLRTRATHLVVAQGVLVGMVLTVAAWLQNASAVVITLPIVIAPRAWLAQRRTLRVAQMEAQLDTWLTTIANALKANPSLGDAIQCSLPLTAAPLHAEIDLVLKAQRLGTPLDRALADMAARIESRVVTSAVTTLRIARQTGGNLGATLESSAASLRELARVEGVVRTRTAEGRAQSFLIGVLPAPLFFVLDLVEPTFLAPLFADTRGHLVLAAAALLWAIAFAWARHIVAVDV